MMGLVILLNEKTANNPILEYWEYIQTNRSKVSKKIYRVFKKLVADISDEASEYEYDSTSAEHAIEFVERYCKHSKGAWGGKPVILELWQRAIVAAIFGFVHKLDRTRKYQEVFLVVARKNGKSTLGAAIGLYLQIADGEAGAEVYAVATKLDQAKLVWAEAKRMVKKSPVLLRRIKPLVRELVADFNDSSFKPLGSDSDTLDGLNVHGAFMDEVHAWNDQNLYDVIVDGTSARENPLIFIITTAGTVRESVFDRLYEHSVMVLNGYEDETETSFKDERFLPFIYELDERDEWQEPDKWQKANPGLGTIKKIDQIERKVNKAGANRALLKNLLCKDFNVRETSIEAWLSFTELNNTNTFDLKQVQPNYGIGGVDLSFTTDLTAAKVIFRVPNDEQLYVLSMYWLPEDLLEQRAKEDKIPYDVWYEQGFLRTTPGNSVDPHFVTQWFEEIRDEYDIYLPWIGYDNWSAKYWVQEMQNIFGKEALIAVQQTKKVLSGPMHLLKAELEKKIINYNNNPIDKWCLSNTSIDVDKYGNIQPAKTKNQRKRIDGTAALLDAFVVYQEKQSEYLEMI